MACKTPAPETVQLVTAEQLCELLHLSMRTIRQMASTGDGPPHIKIGRSVRYRLSDVHEWLNDKAAKSRR